MSAAVIALPPAPPRPPSRLEALTIAVACADWIADTAARDPAHRDAILRAMMADLADQLGIVAIVEPAP